MARIVEPIIIHKRGNSFQFTLNSTCGLPRCVCAEWQRRSFKTLPDELSLYRNPKTKPEAKAHAQVLIAFLRKRQEAGLSAKRPVAEDITVGDWLRKFTRIETSPRTGVTAFKWAYNRELIDRDLYSGIIWFSGKPKERQILSPEQAAAVFRVPWKDERTRLANMLAAVTGLRSGEIRGLRLQDMGRDCLYIRHSWNPHEGLKSTKNNEPRRVELPFPAVIQDLLNLAAKNPHGTGMDSFVFWAALKPDKPLEERLLIKDLRGALIQTGMSGEAARVYTFHAWRHFFTSYMRPRIDEKLLQKQTGHKSPIMIAHYSDHVLAGDRERIQQAQRETFSALIPEAVCG
jgi:integrase